MNVLNGRTTKRYEDLGVLAVKYPDTDGKYISEYVDLIGGQFPLPPIYLKQNIDGTYEPVGEYTRNIICTAMKLLEIFKDTQNVTKSRRVSNTTVNVVVFEPCDEQNLVIELYKNAGIIKE